MFFKRQKNSTPTPDQVFTPRSAEINKEMYVERTDLQLALSQALRSNYHIILFGQSGSGKTWLYKGVLAAASMPFIVSNLANAKRFGSINDELENLITRLSDRKAISTTSEFEINIADVIKKKWGKTIRRTRIKDPFEALLRLQFEASDGHPSIVVFDNLEAIVDDQKLMDELGNLIILLDDETSAQYKVKILIVGVPGDVRDYFQKVKNLRTVANRLYEIPEVTRMTPKECDRLVETGFVHQLRYEIFNLRALQDHVAWVTDRLPQRIHELCLELAKLAQPHNQISEQMLPEANKLWLRQHLATNVAVIERLMNRPGTRIGRRNQILYTIGAIDAEEFDKSDVERVLRERFPVSTTERALNVAGILGELASAEEPILRRGIGSRYRFIDAKYRMCLRVMLQKGANEQVSLVSPNKLV
jgi:hypothetical protein